MRAGSSWMGDFLSNKLEWIGLESYLLLVKIIDILLYIVYNRYSPKAAKVSLKSGTFQETIHNAVVYYGRLLTRNIPGSETVTVCPLESCCGVWWISIGSSQAKKLSMKVLSLLWHVCFISSIFFFSPHHFLPEKSSLSFLTETCWCPSWCYTLHWERCWDFCYNSKRTYSCFADFGCLTPFDLCTAITAGYSFLRCGDLKDVGWIKIWSRYFLQFLCKIVIASLYTTSIYIPCALSASFNTVIFFVQNHVVCDLLIAIRLLHELWAKNTFVQTFL